VIAKKKDFIAGLKKDCLQTEGKLELLPLNALDEEHFLDIIARFPAGEIAIVNEGLLMYLDKNEKEKLCNIIHKVLKERGGYWITADIYIKNQVEQLNLKIDTKTKEFFELHRLEDNKFESFREAQAFFDRMGFKIDKEAKIKRSKLSSMKYLLKCATIRQLLKMHKAGKIQATWRLRIAADSE
jgi:O-methyltransferase involved in polyketide biosynthesis